MGVHIYSMHEFCKKANEYCDKLKSTKGGIKKDDLPTLLRIIADEALKGKHTGNFGDVIDDKEINRGITEGVITALSDIRKNLIPYYDEVDFRTRWRDLLVNTSIEDWKHESERKKDKRIKAYYDAQSTTIIEFGSLVGVFEREEGVARYMRTKEELEEQNYKDLTFGELYEYDLGCEHCPFNKDICENAGAFYGQVPTEPPCAVYEETEIIEEVHKEIFDRILIMEEQEDRQIRAKQRKEQIEAYKERNKEKINQRQQYLDILKELTLKRDLFELYNMWSIGVLTTGKMLDSQKSITKDVTRDCSKDIDFIQKKIGDIQNKIKEITKEIKDDEKEFLKNTNTEKIQKGETTK